MCWYGHKNFWYTFEFLALRCLEIILLQKYYSWIIWADAGHGGAPKIYFSQKIEKSASVQLSLCWWPFNDAPGWVEPEAGGRGPLNGFIFCIGTEWV